MAQIRPKGAPLCPATTLWRSLAARMQITAADFAQDWTVDVANLGNTSTLADPGVVDVLLAGR